MRLGRWSSLLVALSMLASAATAYADCAWVLWIEQTELSHETWSVMWAHRAANDCSRSVADKIKAEAAAAKKQGQDVELPDGANGNTIIRQKGSANQQISRYVCLPDTVDPRGPKAK